MRLEQSTRVPKLAGVFSTLQDVLRNANVHTDCKGNDAGKVRLLKSMRNDRIRLLQVCQVSTLTVNYFNYLKNRKCPC